MEVGMMRMGRTKQNQKAAHPIGGGETGEEEVVGVGVKR